MDNNMKINKDLFPFKLGTTSFIFPDDIIPNVKKLGLLFDEIELLIFESIPANVLPSKKDVRLLKQLAEEFDLTYNIHLPIDISPADVSKLKRDQAVETIVKVIELVIPLNPSTHTLHLEFNDFKNLDNGALYVNEKWLERCSDFMDMLIRHLGSLAMISIETLDYPLELIEPVIDGYKLALCVDAGHLIRHGYGIKPVFEKYSSNIPLIHLHGVDFSKTPPRDHVSLEKTPKERFKATLEVLKTYQGVVSLELFNRNNLISSLACLERLFS